MCLQKFAYEKNSWPSFSIFALSWIGVALFFVHKINKIDNAQTNIIYVVY